MTPENRSPETDALGREELVARAVADYLDLQSRGETVDRNAFCQAHRELLPELRAELETIDQIEQMLAPAEPFSPNELAREELPERLSGHKILSEIGSGGMGRVLLALDEKLDRKVAIKVLSRRYWNNAVLRGRFMQEARAMARLSHPHIARVYDLGEPDEAPHFVMEYLEGTSLTEAAQALSLEQKVELTHKVVLAVEFLHQHQIIHRDLKPANVRVGPDLEPKVLDFGLALQIDQSRRLTTPGEIMGTQDYFSPEQARADRPLDARSDVFSLGTILYQLLTSELPFGGESLGDEIRAICEQDPVLPRRINPTIPGDLQNVCLKALEKNPADRYGSAREMANDLERFLAGEPVLAAPKAYARLMSGKIEQHLRELRGWAQDHLLSESEYDSFRQRYDRLVDREDAWIGSVRRLSLQQVSLYLGAWILVLGAALVVVFELAHLSGTPLVLTVGAAATPTAYLGIRCWKQGQRRIGVAYLLAFCLLLPIALLVAMSQYELLTTPSQNNPDLELFTRATNAQIWWSIFLSLPAYYWLRRLTGNSVYSLVFAVMAALLCLVTLLRMGLLKWIDNDPGQTYLRLIPFALMFFAAAILIDHLRHEADSRYFYLIGVGFTWASLSGVAAYHKPYAEWLQSVFPRTHGQLEYLFILNAGLYWLFQYVFDRVPSAQTRMVAKTFRFVIPGHVLTSLLLLGLEASHRWEKSRHNVTFRHEARFFEVLLPLVACVFVYGSISKQMKNFFASGLVFLAIGVFRLQDDLFEGRARWPVSLLLLGLLLMLAAANYSPLRMGLTRLTRRKP